MNAVAGLVGVFGAALPESSSEYTRDNRCDSAATPSVSPTGFSVKLTIFLVRYGASAVFSHSVVTLPSR